MPEHAEAVLAGAPSVRLVETPTPRAAAQTEDVLVGRIRPDRAAEGNGLVLFLACDNLVKGAALNALQIAELLLEPARSATRPRSIPPREPSLPSRLESTAPAAL